MSEMEVDTDDLRSDATDYWDPWSGKVLELERATRAAYKPLTAADWSGIPGAQDVRVAFEQFLGDVAEFLHTGSEVMEGIARTLLEASADYVKLEDGNVAELAEIQAELEALQ
ncbi:hypothetical protein [Cellulomonas shaoxiangyii]|uniref:Uncharacterized protein n=1 Tax=Cellulomonas shaoxiangyii TaxID=2566013 RepID=A0A4P7SEG1_9CELL|nr:hypothetical protein [Cellulomonas shaoxiangyii]QCB92519.1 hypothetical protein E5225_02050 [Cellulomonas shaoxiangyii]TGY83390.1 hypothetical protein E5226_12210 [Cellulomonas shaoxiangyii]